MHRRNFLHLAALASLAGMTRTLVPNLALAGEPIRFGARHCILLYMHGGPSQFDTFDPKPESKNGGGVRAIESSVSGLRIAEDLPGLAERMNEFVLVRSLTAKEGNHDRARYLMHTGHVPQGAVVHAGLGAHISRVRTSDGTSLPAYVAIDSPGQSPGYLGAAHAPFVVPNPERPVRNLAPVRPLAPERRDRRLEGWRVLEDAFASNHDPARTTEHRAVSQRAVEMSASAKLEAFDLARESDATVARYGDDRFGRGCLMARRLVDVGVPFVEVGLRGWDTHEDNAKRSAELSRTLDRGMTALVDDLRASGKWNETLLVWLGDFGRTPKINPRGGRDHFPTISNVLLGGAGLRPRIIGSTDRDGESITQDPVSVPDLFATLCHILSLPADEMHMTRSGRPVPTVDPAGRVLLP